MYEVLIRYRKSTIGRLLFVYTIFSVFSNCINPITPALFLELGFPDYMFGVGYAAMAVACFFFSPLWGKLCDRYGYTQILNGSFLGYALIQCLFSVSVTQSAVILCRFLNGAAYSAGLVSSLAYLMAAAPAEKNHNIMLYYAAATTGGCAIGYSIGGFIGTISIQYTFYFQILILLILWVFSFSILKDPERSHNLRAKQEKTVCFETLPSSSLAPLFFTEVFFASFAAAGYDNAYNYYIKEALHFPNYYNGLIRAGIGLITLGMTVTIGVWIAKKYNLRIVLVPVFFLCSGITCWLCHIKSTTVFISGNFIYYAVCSLYLPFQQEILAEGDGADKGRLSGKFNSCQYAGKVLGALCAGFAYEIASKLPFIISSAVFFLSMLVASADLIYRKHHTR